MLKLGQVAKDKITGFQGVIIGRCEYLTGCTQVLIVPQKLGADGKRQDGEWFDEQRVTPTGKTITLDNGTTPGSDERAPSRNR